MKSALGPEGMGSGCGAQLGLESTLRSRGRPGKGTGGKQRQVPFQGVRGEGNGGGHLTGLCNLLLKLGFHERVKGSHHIFWKESVAEIVNLQPKGSKAKPYQVKQVRAVLVKYKMGGSPDAEV